MRTFTESDLTNYPHLTANSLVMDVGGFDGSFTDQIHSKYDCVVHVYEPVPEFFNGLVRRFSHNPDIRLWPFALGDSNRKEPFLVKGSMSGSFVAEPNSATVVPMRDFVEIVDSLPKTPDLVALNCEGGEFQILEYALDTGLAATLPFIQVQSHTVVHNYQERWDRIVRRLTETHEHVFSAPWCWDGFALRKGGAL